MQKVQKCRKNISSFFTIQFTQTKHFQRSQRVVKRSRATSRYQNQRDSDQLRGHFYKFPVFKLEFAKFKFFVG